MGRMDVKNKYDVKNYSQFFFVQGLFKSIRDMLQVTVPIDHQVSHPYFINKKEADIYW